MNIEAVGTGKTVDEAIDAACSEIGMPRENVDIEILELPKKKLFGLMSVQAKVKVTLQEEYVKKYIPKEQPKKAPEEKPAAKAEAPKQEERKPQPQQKKPQQPKPQPKPQPQQQSAPAEEKAPAEEEKPLAPEVVEAKGAAAAAYIKEILLALGHSDADVKYSQKDGMIVLQLSGEDMGAVVGRRGDNLDALQYLASLVANRSEGSYVRVVLDIDDYRSKREASLQAYARKTAFQVIKSGRSTTLEAMNPYERRIVHSTVQTVNGATSKSVGTEPNRRVIISPVEGARPRGDRRPPRGDRNDRGDRGGDHGDRGDRPQRPFRQNRDRGESKKVDVPANGEPPKNDTSSISLYGKINLD